MKTFSNLYEYCLMEENRRKAAKDIRKSKRIRRIMMKEHYTIDSVVIDGYDWISRYENGCHTPITIHDGLSKKKRVILVPTLEELFVQHCVIDALKPMLFQGMYEHSYGSIPGRGCHKGKKTVEKWIKHNRKDTKYVLKMDIRHFFDTIPHDILKSKLSKKMRDPQMLALLFDIIDTTDIGLPLGFYTSQWLSNWYLQDLDHFVKEKLGAKYYIRYMDDMVIFGSNKKQLHSIRYYISEYLFNELGLELKSNWQVYRFDHQGGNGRDLDFMGFRFYRNRTTLRRSIMLRATRKALKISKKIKHTVFDARQMLSYFGWIKSTNTYKMYLKWIKPRISIGLLKKKVSIFDHIYGYGTYIKLIRLYS